MCEHARTRYSQPQPTDRQDTKSRSRPGQGAGAGLVTSKEQALVRCGRWRVLWRYRGVIRDCETPIPDQIYQQLHRPTAQTVGSSCSAPLQGRGLSPDAARAQRSPEETDTDTAEHKGPYQQPCRHRCSFLLKTCENENLLYLFKPRTCQPACLRPSRCDNAGQDRSCSCVDLAMGDREGLTRAALDLAMG